MRIILVALITSLAVGCAGQPAPTAERPGVNLSGYPPAFRAGYADGCASAKPNAARFRSDANYAQGWRDGYDICGRR